MSIEENMALAYMIASGKHSLFGRITKSDKERFREHLALLDMGLEDRMKNPVGLLSGGQRQALTLLMATMVTPKLLLLDEHTAALDPKTAKKVLEITKQIVADQHLTALMVTHNMKDAIATGNRLIMMYEGRIIFEASGEDKKKLTVDELMRKFSEVAGEEFSNDQALLTR